MSIAVCERGATLEQKMAGQPTVLVVDDDQSLLMLWQVVLDEELHCRVVTASSAEHALCLPFATPPDLLILDFCLSLFGLNGIELYDTYKRRAGWQSIPAIMTSATLPVEDVQRRRIVGIHKPFDLYSTLSTVEKLLSSPSTSSEDAIVSTQSLISLPTWEEAHCSASPDGYRNGLHREE